MLRKVFVSTGELLSKGCKSNKTFLPHRPSLDARTESRLIYCQLRPLQIVRSAPFETETV